jgi:four helix bundle protein
MNGDGGPEPLRQRTKRYALRIMRLSDSLPKKRSANVIAYQVLRSGTSVGAQYREALRARSDAEMISKFESVLQELDETAYWLELLMEDKIVAARKLEPLCRETDELTAIFVAAVKTLKQRRG